MYDYNCYFEHYFIFIMYLVETREPFVFPIA